jgi:hypothetical protein
MSRWTGLSRLAQAVSAPSLIPTEVMNRALLGGSAKPILHIDHGICYFKVTGIGVVHRVVEVQDHVLVRRSWVGDYKLLYQHFKVGKGALVFHWLFLLAQSL